MAQDDFFKEENQEEIEEVEKIKVGEKEYDQETLNRLVNLGEIAVEAEEKYNRPISKFWPEYTRNQQELEKLRTENEQLKTPKKDPQVDPATGLSDEQVATQIKDTLGKYGYVPADDVRKIASEVVSGYRLLDQVNQVVSKRAEDGNPKTTSEDLLEFMQENNLSNPELAYKVKFEKELDEIKEKKLASIKPQGMVTDGKSTAGGKMPEPVKVTKSNLGDILDGYLTPRNA